MVAFKLTRMKSILFPHIPKTAGTSIYCAFCNVFGDANVTRFARAVPPPGSDPSDFLRPYLGRSAAIIGHLSYPFWERFIPQAHAFTVLREPVARVLSLFRYLQTRPTDELAIYGLAKRFTISDFLACRHSEVGQQIDNGMCRFLGSYFDSGDLRVSADPQEFLERAEDTLGTLDVALIEDLELALERWAAGWGIPFAIEIPRENVTWPLQSDEPSGSDLAEIIARNALDIALYNRARNVRVRLDCYCTVPESPVSIGAQY